MNIIISSQKLKILTQIYVCGGDLYKNEWVQSLNFLWDREIFTNMCLGVRFSKRTQVIWCILMGAFASKEKRLLTLSKLETAGQKYVGLKNCLLQHTCSNGIPSHPSSYIWFLKHFMCKIYVLRQTWDISKKWIVIRLQQSSYEE